MDEPKTALVTGAAGFIGSHVVDRLLMTGIDVIAVDDLSGGYIENVNPLATFYRGDIINTGFINRLFETEEPDFVFHLAAYAAEGLSHFIRHYNYMDNLIGSINLINASVNHDVSRFIFTSSIATYGHIDDDDLPVKEEMAGNAVDPYGIAKVAVEQDLKAAQDMFGLEYTIFRPHNVYGERQNIADKYRNVIGIFMNQILNGEPLTIFGDGSQTRAFSYIDDIARPIVSSIFEQNTYNQIFNIGSDEVCSVGDLAYKVITAMGEDASTYPVRFLEARNEVHNIFTDHSKADAIFGDSKTSLDYGLQRMANWVKANGPRKSVGYDKIEILRNLPQKWLEMLVEVA